jgi:uncharacterized membrane protein
MMTETHKRSIVKAITYRIFGFVASAAIGLLVTGDWEKAMAFGFLDAFVKVFGYYFHERLWMKVRFGKPQPPDYQI